MRVVRFGIIGAGLMGREFASAAGRWLHLVDFDARPEIVAVADPDPRALAWFGAHVPTATLRTPDYRALLADPDVEAVYVAVPHHLHAAVYRDVLAAGKHLMGEKPFGIDREANREILDSIAAHPDLLVRCSSEFPFYPGAYRLFELVRRQAFGRILEVEAGFWHASDLDPKKPLNWKRRIAQNGAYGSMGDLGLHVVHLPFVFGWVPRNVRAVLTKVYDHRPNADGVLEPTETWDNAVLLGEVDGPDGHFPITFSTKRIAPGHTNTWFLRIVGTEGTGFFTTQAPRTLERMTYRPGEEQAVARIDLGSVSAYPTITGAIFEVGFSDALLQMWAAFLDELVHGTDKMRQPLTCATPEVTRLSHALFTAALESQESGGTVPLAL